MLVSLFITIASLCKASAVENVSATMAPSISIIGGPNVRIPGITASTVIQLSGYNTNYPVRWLRNGMEVGSGPTHWLTVAGTYVAQANLSTNPNNPFWVQQATISIPALSHSISISGPTTLTPTAVTSLCLTSNASSYILSRNWLRNGVDENRTSEPTCRNAYVPGTYRVEVIYQYGGQTSMITTSQITLFTSSQAPVTMLSKTTHDPVSPPPVLTVTNFSNFSSVHVFKNSVYLMQMTSSSMPLPGPARYQVGGMLSGNIVYAPEIVITKGSIPTPAISSDGGLTLTYQDPDLRLSTAGNYNAGYSWYFNDVIVSGATTNFIDIYQPGSYKVTACATHLDGQTECKASATTVVTGETLFVNYVRKKTALAGGIVDPQQLDLLPGSQVSMGTTYFDGFIRPIQSVSKAHSPAGKDEVNFIAYDAFERETKKYLPFVRTTNDGKFRHMSSSNISMLNQFYLNADDGIANTSYPYGEIAYESSPLNRVVEEAGPGEDWRSSTGHTVNYDYTTNKSSDQVRIWKKDAQGMTANGYYAEGTLTVTETTDEHEQLIRRFSNRDGEVVLEETPGEGGLRLRTYHIFDDLHKLVCVIPPKTVQSLVGATITLDDATLKRECFRFTYDESGRLIIKHVPGAEPVWIVYDPWDRPVLSQTGNQRAQNRWGFKKYDALDRLIMMGEIVQGGDRQTVAQMVQNFYADVSANLSIRFEEQGSAFHGYTNRSFPVLANEQQAFSITYYDNYNFLTPAEAVNYQFVQEPELSLMSCISRVQGLTTGVKHQVLGTQQYLRTVNYYDDRYRVVQEIIDNHRGSIDRTSSQFDFANRLLKERSIHESVATTKDYAYDTQGRLLKVYYKLNNEPVVVLADHHYNELGKLTEKNLHQDVNGNYFQSLDYSYNIHGWMSAMNATSGEPTVYNDFYRFELFYNELNPFTNNMPQFNGNVSALKEVRPFEEDNLGELTSVYNYHYDPGNQVKRANYFRLSNTALNSGYDEIVSYDANGNIATLNRNSITSSGLEIIDNLTYNYTGNQLQDVSDDALDNVGFKDANTTADYGYDANGNLIRDANKGITSISYNMLDRPELVTFADGRIIRYTYLSSAEKLKQEVFTAAGALKVKRDYIGDVLYCNDTIREIHHLEGRIVPRIPGPGFSAGEYQYYLKDHLGNVKTTFTTDIQQDTYQAGMEDTGMALESNTFNPSYDYAVRYNSTIYNHTTGGTKSQRLSAAGDREIIGLAKSLRVMPGDKINMEVYAKYFTPSSVGTDVSTLMLTAISSAFGVSAGGGEGSIYQSFSALDQAGLLVHNGKGVDEGAPKAYLNYILFDENYRVYDLGFDQISTSALTTGKGTPHDQLTLEATVRRPGYIYIYLSNESDVITDVFFDDLTIAHTHSPIVETTDYYPFGMIAREDSREGMTAQSFKYNGKELQKDEELDWYDFGARMYDAALGRWHAIDPMAEKYASWSPYQYVMNNPMKFIDPDGRDITYHTSDPTPKGYADPQVMQKYLRQTKVGKQILQEAEKNKNVKVYVSFRTADHFSTSQPGKITVGTTTGLHHPDVSVAQDASSGKSTLTVANGSDLDIFNGIDITDDVKSGKQIYLVAVKFSFNPYVGAEALGHEIEAHVNLDQDKAIMETGRFLAELAKQMTSGMVTFSDADIHHEQYGTEEVADYRVFFNQATKKVDAKVEGSTAKPGSTGDRLQKELAKSYKKTWRRDMDRWRKK